MGDLRRDGTGEIFIAGKPLSSRLPSSKGNDSITSLMAAAPAALVPFGWETRIEAGHNIVPVLALVSTFAFGDDLEYRDILFDRAVKRLSSKCTGDWKLYVWSESNNAPCRALVLQGDQWSVQLLSHKLGGFASVLELIAMRREFRATANATCTSAAENLR